MSKVTEAVENLQATVAALGGKGKGKSKGGSGKAKGGGKGIAQPTILKQGQWRCLCNWCPWANADKLNHGFRKSCGGRATPKSDAMNPPAVHRVSPKGAPSVSLKQQQAQALAA